MTFANDEAEERCDYLESKYHALVRRMGASQEDIDAIEEELMQTAHERRMKRQSRQSKNERKLQAESADMQEDSPQYEPVNKPGSLGAQNFPDEDQEVVAVTMGNPGGLVNSYEIYGERHPDEVEADYGEDDEAQYEPQYQEPYGPRGVSGDASQAADGT